MIRGSTAVVWIALAIPAGLPGEEPDALSPEVAVERLLAHGLQRRGQAWLVDREIRLQQALGQLTALADRHNQLGQAFEQVRAGHHQSLQRLQQARQLISQIQGQLAGDARPPRDRLRLEQELVRQRALANQLAAETQPAQYGRRLREAAEPWWKVRLELMAAILAIREATPDSMAGWYTDPRDDPEVRQALVAARARWPQADLGPATNIRRSQRDQAESLGYTVFDDEVPCVPAEQVLIPVLVHDRAGWQAVYRPDRDYSIVPESAVRAADVDGEAPHERQPVLLGLGNDVREAYRVRLQRIRLGGVVVEGVEVLVLPDLPETARPELGTNILGGRSVQLDREAAILRFEAPAASPESAP